MPIRQDVSWRVLSGSALTLLLLCQLWVNGCSNSVSSEGSVSQDDTSAQDGDQDRAEAADGSQSAHEAASSTEDKPPEPLLAEWTPPAAAIILSGEQHGYLEPCGCSERQSGGLARRTDLANQLRSRGWPVTGFDLGGTVKRSRRQSQLKLEFTRDALDIIGYKGLGLGLEDLRLGSMFLYEAHAKTNVESGFDLPYLSANVTFFGDDNFETPLNYRIVEVGGVRIGVTAVFGESYLPELFPNGVNPEPDLLRIDPPATILPGVVAQMESEQPDVTLLLAHAKPDESRALAQQFPNFDLVVTAGGPEDPDGQAERLGQTLLLRVGTKGKNVGIVGVYPGAANSERFRFEVVELDRFRFDSASAIDDRMREYQQQLQSENLLEAEQAIAHPRGAGFTFIGSEKCADCHYDEYEVWVNSPHHTDGFESLTVAYAQASDDPSMASRVRVDRIYDPECICCHTAGWDPQEVVRFETGYLSQEKSPHLKGVHCESCHGPASRHVELEESLDATETEQIVERAAMAVKKEYARKNLCIQCHDFENSPDFDFDTYWEEIEH